eukprot:scaffold8376_cov33-Tisochrysis_lutea.AAC.1
MENNCVGSVGDRRRGREASRQGLQSESALGQRGGRRGWRSRLHTHSRISCRFAPSTMHRANAGRGPSNATVAVPAETDPTKMAAEEYLDRCAQVRRARPATSHPLPLV